MTEERADRFDVVADAEQVARDVGFLDGEEEDPSTCEECPACRIRHAIDAINTPEDAARLGITLLLAINAVAEITKRFEREARG